MQPPARPTSVLFADLTGSTGVFEALGNAVATRAITAFTQEIGRQVERHDGRVVKMLGDGVLAVFASGAQALKAAVAIQRAHMEAIQEWPNPARMRLQVGVASGDVVIAEGDCFGDAVNVASRLSDLSGPDQILATVEAVHAAGPARDGFRMRSLGPVQVRGRTVPLEVFRIEWEPDVMTQQLTQPASLELLPSASRPRGLSLHLSWLDQASDFLADEFPVALGRVEEAQFVVNDQRVSRLHARILSRSGRLVLEDVSSFGTWLRFEGSPAEICLRREECMLHTNGEIALGAGFDDFTAPVVTFRISGN